MNISIDRPYNQHKELIGLIAHVSFSAPEISEAIREEYDFGYSVERIERWIWFQKNYKGYGFIFIKEKPEWWARRWYYCLMEIGTGSGRRGHGDWIWMPLECLIICRQ